ncbi:flagellar biosynthetic protein FliO [Massilia aquatica]|uniref:FliO/MopB family protein n=1 Tax=Massilia aquatica TaxID=2609000 RepID=A0ABX0M8F9_9BURK|nr:flagellar biosynthetic protein FliO [Massilia aquatica]NHZ42594.1 FliO/MopB family protein [Massilia aquatica]
MNALRAALGVLLLSLTMALPAAARAEAPSAPPAAPRAAAHTPIPFKQDKQGAGSLAYQSMAGLVLAALAAYGVIFALKRYSLKGGGPLRQARRLRTIESMRLSRRSTLHVVHYDGEELLLAESDNGLRLVSSRSAVAVEAKAVAAAQGDQHA